MLDYMCRFKFVSCMLSTAGLNSLCHVEQFRKFTLTIHRLLTVLTYNKRSILEINIECYIVYVRLFHPVSRHCVTQNYVVGNYYISSSGFLIKLAVGR